MGKSTFFNRLCGGREAIVDEASGVTRDRHYGTSNWNGKDFTVIDTGGYVQGSDDIFEGEIQKQVLIALNEASAVVFMNDVTTGITDLDTAVAKILRKVDKPIFVAVNKVDNHQRQLDVPEFYNLGMGDIYPLSSINGSGTGELLDAVVNSFEDEEIEEDELPKIAAIGRPNVGKSSLVNMLLGEERNIVTDIPGTTRDSIDTRFNAFGFDFTIIDTAGLRKKSKVKEDLEFYSVMRTVSAAERADVGLLMIDATEGIGAQDLNILQLMEKRHKGVVILVNKWDLVTKETMTTAKLEEQIKERIAPWTDIPILFTSVKNKQRIHKALETAIHVYKMRSKKIKTSELNEKLLPIIQETPPPSVKGKYIKIKFVTQLPTAFPAFAFFCNHPQYVRESYRRFLENQIRTLYDFKGVPIEVYLRKK